MIKVRLMFGPTGWRDTVQKAQQSVLPAATKEVQPSTGAAVLCLSITVWFGSSTKQDRSRLQQLGWSYRTLFAETSWHRDSFFTSDVSLMNKMNTSQQSGNRLGLQGVPVKQTGWVYGSKLLHVMLNEVTVLLKFQQSNW
ncbi:hypothetical protein ATANTOWER_010035 [Ataeniobius toweri]|uniref:Uncharacterized protein n=1 Tax=Ataeniobius toweri TaxID=208326 RepID=A0ABU7C8M5_9TELE|nr:hypothetical protein [Ataeniobius toweri]